jgi:hypothetical protein
LGKNLNNSQKFSLVMVLMNVNLDCINFMQKSEDPTQVAFDLDLIMKKNLNLNLNVVLGFAL